jgi:hypothetical protein
MKRMLIVTVLLLAFCAPSFAADPDPTSGTWTVTPKGVDKYLKRVTLDWICDASGNFLATTTQVQGTIERLVINPDAGATSPTADYDLTISDVDSVDLLSGLGANLSDSVTSSTTVMATDGTTPRPMATVGTLTIAITNAGNARGGVIRFYIRR